MKYLPYCGPGVLMALMLASCADRAPAPTDQLKIQVAQLTLPGITNVDYSVGVYTSDGASNYELVWSEDSVDADTYGNSIGDITYVGPCDADGESDSDAEGEKPGWVVIDISV